jgi:hypothetical protein
VDNKNNAVESFCFLDSLSNASFISREQLNGRISTETTELTTLSGTEERVMKKMGGLKVNSRKGLIELPELYIVDKLPLDGDDIREEIENWPHLKSVKEKITMYNLKSAKPLGLLIGNESPRLLEPYDVIRPSIDSGGPYAIEYLLGWSAVGPCSEMSTKASGKVNRSDMVAVTEIGTVLRADSEFKTEEQRDW